MRIKNPSGAKLRVLSLISLVATTFVLSQRTFGQAEVVTSGGLVTTTLKTPQGAIQVNLPDEMSGPLSGSIRAFPLGQTMEEKARNLEMLNTYAIRMEDRNTPVASGLIQRMIHPLSLFNIANRSTVPASRSGFSAAVSTGGGYQPMPRHFTCSSAILPRRGAERLLARLR